MRVCPVSADYFTMDAIAFTEGLPSAVAGIATSPPYNKAFRKRGGRASNWAASRLMADNYETYDDDLPPGEYVAWQRRFLDTAVQAVGDSGVVLYNIGRAIRNLGEDRREEIVRGFPVRQTIVWNRGSSNNQGGRRPSIFPPIYELIYIVAGPSWRLPERWLREMRAWGDVWNIPFEVGNPHPAPFPVALAERMVKVVDGLVADPFAGSGTIGIAAHRLGYPSLLNDICADYKRMFEERLAREIEQQRMAV